MGERWRVCATMVLYVRGNSPEGWDDAVGLGQPYLPTDNLLDVDVCVWDEVSDGRCDLVGLRNKSGTARAQLQQEGCTAV